MAKESYIVVHPFGDYCAELEPGQAEFTEFVPWAELTQDQRANAINNQIAFDYLLSDARFVQEAGTPEEWADYSESDYLQYGELEPIGLVKVAARVVEDDTNYTNYLNPAFRRISKGE